MVDDVQNRRDFLKKGGAVAAALSLSGCSGLFGSTETESISTQTTENSEEGDTRSPEIDSLKLKNAKFLPIASDQQVEPATATINATDESGFKSAKVSIKDADRWVSAHQNSGTSSTKKQFQAEIPAQYFSPGNNTLKVELTDRNGNSMEKEFSKSWDQVNWQDNPIQAYRVETSHVQNDTYATERSWDDTSFDQQRINQQRQEWQQAARYDGFLSKVKNDADFTKYNIGYPNWTEDSYGHFDLETFRETSDWEEMLLYINGAVRTETFEQHDGPPSGHANEMAASAEKAIEEVRGDEVRAWGVFNPGHGTWMAYTEEDEAEHRWYHIDTTANGLEESIQRPENALEHRPDIWSPFRSTDAPQPGFHQGFDVDEVEGVNTYGQMKRVALGSLARMVASGKPQDVEGQYIFATEEWLDSAYQHIREDGKIDPIRDSFEELVDEHMQNDEKYAGVYGTGLDDTRLASGEELEDVYSQVMGEPGNVSASEIEGMLEGQAAA